MLLSIIYIFNNFFISKSLEMDNKGNVNGKDVDTLIN